MCLSIYSKKKRPRGCGGPGSPWIESVGSYRKAAHFRTFSWKKTLLHIARALARTLPPLHSFHLPLYLVILKSSPEEKSQTLMYLATRFLSYASSPHVCLCQPKDNHPPARLSIKSATTFHTALFIHSSRPLNYSSAALSGKLIQRRRSMLVLLQAPPQQTPCTQYCRLLLYECRERIFRWCCGIR